MIKSTDLNWQSIVTSYDRNYMVKGTELARALCGPNSRFAIYEVRTLAVDPDGKRYSDVQYRVRDAETVSDNQVRHGVRPKIVYTGDTLDAALQAVNYILGQT